MATVVLLALLVLVIDTFLCLELIPSAAVWYSLATRYVFGKHLNKYCTATRHALALHAQNIIHRQRYTHVHTHSHTDRYMHTETEMQTRTHTLAHSHT